MTEIDAGRDGLNLADTLNDYDAGYIEGVLDARGIEKPTREDLSTAFRLLQLATWRRLSETDDPA